MSNTYMHGNVSQSKMNQDISARHVRNNTDVFREQGKKGVRGEDEGGRGNLSQPPPHYIWPVMRLINQTNASVHGAGKCLAAH